MKSSGLQLNTLKQTPILEVSLLASKMIEYGFYQCTSKNGISFEIICRCCGKNVFKDFDDDDEGIVSSFAIFEDAMLSLPMACYYHRLKSVALFQTNNGNAMKFIRNRLLHSLSKEEEELKHSSNIHKALFVM